MISRQKTEVSRQKTEVCTLFSVLCSLFSVLCFLFSVLWLANAALACPMCKEAMASQSDPVSAQLVKGYARSIYLLMSAPYLLFAGVTFFIVRSTRRGPKR